MAEKVSKKLFLGGICFITDQSCTKLSCEEMVELALQAGVRWVQYRNKDQNGCICYEEALMLRKLTRKYGASFIVNDHADIAAAVGADGVHLGQYDLPIKEARKIVGKDFIVGISTHNEDEALRAESDGADYIGFGPVFSTATKADAGEPMGTDMLSYIGRKVKIPVVAIGGVGPDNLRPIFSTGVNAVAVATAILMGDIRNNVGNFLKTIKELQIGSS